MQIPNSIFITTLVIAVTQLVKFIRDKNWNSVVTIVSAALIGVLAGVLSIEGLTAITGLLAGLAAAGVVTVAEKISSK